MSDSYSLMKLRNRLAIEGEELVAHRFQNGMIGMVSRCDFERWRRTAASPGEKPSISPEQQRNGVWQTIKNFWADFLAYYGFVEFGESAFKEEPGPVIGIPTEALLRVFDISPDWQEQYHCGWREDALFIELSPPSRGNALCFGNGAMVPIRLLHEGQRVKVLRRSWAESLEPEPEFIQAMS